MDTARLLSPGGAARASCLGGATGLLSTLSDLLAREGLINQSRDYFAAAQNQTVTKFVAQKGVPALQLEINATWLNPGGGPLQEHRFAQLLQGLTRFIHTTGCRVPTPTTGR